MGHHARDKFGDIVNQDMITPFLAISEKQDFLTRIGLTAKPVWSVAVVGIVRTIKQARTQDRRAVP